MAFVKFKSSFGKNSLQIDHRQHFSVENSLQLRVETEKHATSFYVHDQFLFYFLLHNNSDGSA